MADKNLRIQIEALIKGLAGVQALGAQFDKLGQSAAGAAGKGGLEGRGVSGLEAALSNLQKPLPGVSGAIADLMEANQKAADSFNSLLDLAKKATVALIAYAGVRLGTQAAELAANNETLQNTMYLIGGTAGYTKDQLDSYEKKLKDVGITTSVARDTMIQFIRANIDIGPASQNAEARIVQLARAAQNLAKATGQNTSETLQRMLLNIQQLDTVGLRFIGVTVQSEKAFADYAKTIKKTANELTTAEKQQALMNEVVKQGGALAGIYEKSLETTGGKLGSLKRYQEEASASIGALLLPAYGKLIDAQTAFLKWAAKTADALRENGQVAQVLGDVAEAVFNTVGRLGEVAFRALSNIAGPLSNMITSLQAAFQGFSIGGLLSTIEALIGKVVQWASAMADAVAENAPLIRIVAESFSLVTAALSDVADQFGIVFGSLSTGLTLADALGVVLTTIGFLVAGFADGLKLAGAAANIMLAGLGVGFGVISTIIGKIVGFMLPDMGAAFEEIGSKAVAFGMKAAESARGTIADFANGKTAVQGFRDMLATLPTNYDKLDKASKDTMPGQKTAFQQAEESVRKYAEEVRKGNLTTAQAEAKYKALSAQILALANAGKITKPQLDQLSQSLNVNKERASKLEEVFKNLELKMTEFSTGMSDAGGKASAAFFDMAREGTFTADQLNLAFNKALTYETSLQGLTRYQTALQSVKTLAVDFLKGSQIEVEELRKKFQSGTITLQEYAAGMSAIEKKTAGARAQLTEFEAGTQAVKVKFAELLKVQLGLVKTEADARALNNTLVDMGNKGLISANQVYNGLQDVQEALRGTRAETLRLSGQFVAMAEKNASVSDRGLSVNKSQLEVQRAQMGVQQAQAQYAADGTDQSKAQLALAQEQQRVAVQQARQTQIDQQVEMQGRELLKAQQDKANADAALERDKGNEQLQRNARAANSELETKTLSVDKTKAAAAEQRVVTNNTQATADRAALVVEKQKAAAEATKQTEAATQNWLGGLSQIYSQLANTQKMMLDLGFTAQEAQSQQLAVTRAMGGGMNGVVTSMSTFIGHLSNAIKLQESFVANAKFQKQLAEDQMNAFAVAKEKAQQMADAAAGIKNSMVQSVFSGTIFNKLMESTRKEADALSRSAIDSAKNFLRSVASIRDELLEAQGREDESAAARFEARKKDLKLEYEILKAKLEGAKITAQAAGVSTTGIQQALNDLNKGYSDAVRDLDALQKIDEDKRKKAKLDAEEERRLKAIEDAKAKVTVNGVPTTQGAPDQGSTPTVNYGADIQGMLSELLSTTKRNEIYGGGSGVEMHQIVRRVEVTLRANGNSPVTVETNESDEAALIRMLEQSRGVA